MRKKILAIVAVIMVIGLCGCSYNETTTISIVGSTSEQALTEKLTKSFKETNYDVEFSVEGGGSDAAIPALDSGDAQIGAVSRNLTDKEKDSTSTVFTFAKDGIAVVVNKENNVKNLNQYELAAIYNGLTANWASYGGTNEEITVFQREDGSGTRASFEKTLGIKGTLPATKDTTCNSTEEVLKKVAETKGGIGYVSFTCVTDDVKMISVDGINPNRTNVKNGIYPLTHPFTYVTSKEADKQTRKLTKEFFDFVKSDTGNVIIEKYGLVPAN